MCTLSMIPYASSEAVAASAAHIDTSALNDSLEAEPDEFGSCKSLHDLKSGPASCDVMKLNESVSGKSAASRKPTTSGKPAASQRSAASLKPTQNATARQKKHPAMPPGQQSNASSSARSKTKPPVPPKTDKSLKRLSRDSPLAGCKP